jgi:hypothetical protein
VKLPSRLKNQRWHRETRAAIRRGGSAVCRMASSHQGPREAAQSEGLATGEVFGDHHVVQLPHETGAAAVHLADNGPPSSSPQRVWALAE